jgi:hypothetical protein
MILKGSKDNSYERLTDGRLEDKFTSWLKSRPNNETIPLHDVLWVLDLLEIIYWDAFNLGFEIGLFERNKLNQKHENDKEAQP